MNLIKDFIQLFTKDEFTIDNLEPTEDFYEAKISFNFKNYSPPDKESFINVSSSICQILESDTFEFMFKVIDKKRNNTNITPDLTYKFSKSTLAEPNILIDCFNEIRNEKFEEIDKCNEYLQLVIIIKKPMDLQNTNRIYFFNKFAEYLNNLSLKEILVNIFSKLLNDNDKVIFLIDKDVEEFYSSNIFFIHCKETLDNINIPYRNYDQILKNYRLNCRFIGNDLVFTPYAFSLCKKSTYNSINNFFSKLSFITSLIYIANYSEFETCNVLKVHLNGYKLITEKIDFSNLDNRYNIYYDIFDWVYSNGNISDKLNLSRNIITLDYRDSLLNINEKTLASIESNYEIYLKDNVEKYIKLKTKITDSLIEISMKSREITSDFSISFKNNFIAILSFIFTIFFANIVNNHVNSTEIFNREISIIYLIINIISFLYMVFSRISVKKDLQHYDKTIESLKNSYVGLLSPNDLDNIFNNKILANDKAHIRNKIRLFSALWITTIFISLIGLYALSAYFRSLLVLYISNTIYFIINTLIIMLVLFLILKFTRP